MTFTTLHPSQVLKDDLEYHKLTKEQLAELLNVSIDTVNQMLTKDYHFDKDLSKKLAYIFKCSETLYKSFQEQYYDNLERIAYVFADHPARFGRGYAFNFKLPKRKK